MGCQPVQKRLAPHRREAGGLRVGDHSSTQLTNKLFDAVPSRRLRRAIPRIDARLKGPLSKWA